MSSGALGAKAQRQPPTAPVSPGSSANAPVLPPLLKSIEAKYSQFGTLTAEFNEVNTSFLTKKTKKSTGHIDFKRPGKIYWQTLQPMQNLLVSDGKTFWYYTPPFDADEPGQYWEKPASRVQSKFAQSLLSGNFYQGLLNHTMTFQQKSTSDYVILPKKGTADNVTNAILHVDTKSIVITGVELNYTDGNRASITLSNIQLGSSLADSHFHFTPPPKSEKIKD